MKTLTVELGDRSYPIYIGENILERLGEFMTERGMPKKSPLLIVSDEKVAPYHLERVQRVLSEAGYQHASSVVPSGEKSKSLAVMEQVIADALQANLDRSSTIIALGGGVVGDLAGYAAASYMRGVKFVQIPTTILAHDSSVGGKVAVNHPLAKNIIGAFHQPEMVVYDTTTLRTLPEREIRAGYAEMIKHGLIWNKAFAAWVEEHADPLLALDSETVQQALYESCQVKTIVVSQDEREQGLRAILNLGHTIGHAIEAVAGYGEMLHGEAISIGMIGSAKLGVHYGCPEQVLTVTRRMLAKFGLPTKLPHHYDTDKIISAMGYDKKFKEGAMVFVVPTDIGTVEIRKDVPRELVRNIVDQLKQEA